MRATMCIPAHQVSPPLRALFDVGQSVAIRCFAVLDGTIRGQIWTDDLAQPTWGAVQEAAYGTLFLGGRPNASLVYELVEELRQEQDVSLALWPNHPYNQLLPHCAPADRLYRGHFAKQIRAVGCTASESDLLQPAAELHR